jgi:meso-butanediol dehydrogenase / (S,S)-butanediol dehydrogenase / diacetyl reductase
MPTGMSRSWSTRPVGGPEQRGPRWTGAPAAVPMAGPPGGRVATGDKGENGMTGRFAGRVGAVTGAGSGLGRCTAERLAAEGAHVACVDIDGDLVAATADGVSRAGGQARPYVCDVSDPGAVKATVAAIVADHGGLHVLCNVAGIGMFGHSTGIAYQDWCRILAVNLTGPFLMCQAALPHLVEVGGNIVNVASDAGSMGLPFGAPYSASKGGLVMLTKSLAREFIERGVRVNAVSPGGMQTAMAADWHYPDDMPLDLMGRFHSPMGTADPSDIAAVIAFVASDDAKRLTGAVVAADGGSTA